MRLASVSRYGLVLALWGASGLLAAAPDDIVVSAAVSLSEAMGEVARAFERETRIRVTLNLGPSSTLARQIREGAHVDLFISADEDQMDAVQRAGRIVSGSRTPLLSNQLVVVAPADRVVHLRSARDLLKPEFRRIATGDPAAIPVGVYAKRYLESQGLWSDVARKLVPTDGVRAALAAVEQGHADLAIVYRTDAATARRASIVFVVPRDQGPRIVYPAAVLTTGRNREGAMRFLVFLKGAAARTMFERAGFDVLLPKP